jgi:hypothetical protein
MPTERLFLDIRYYESDHENVDYMSLPDGPGRIFTFPKSISFLGARIARKLREYGFVAGVYDHLYVNFTTMLHEGQYRYSPREVGERNRIKYIDFGLFPARTNRLSMTKKESLVCGLTFDVVRFVARERPARLAVVDRVAAEIGEKGTELEIVHKTKETAAYAVTVSYQIRPNGNPSVGLIEYHDKKTGQRFKAEFKLKDYEDAFALVGSISVSHGVISLKPRSSFKASLYTRRYRLPIEIPIAEMDVR